MVRFLQRYPAMILGIVAACLQMLMAWGIPLSDGKTAAINAALAAVFGVATSFFLARDQLLPAILGLGQAGFTLFLAFGYDISPNKITMTMAFIAVVAAAFTHTQVDAIRGPDGRRVQRRSLYGRAA